MMISALVFAAVLAGGDPDEIVTTAPATTVDLTAAASAVPDAPTASGAAQQAAQPHNLTTDQQIDRWLSSRDPEARPYERATPDRPVDDRKMHGEFIAGIGTGGYRDYGMAVTLPVGDNARLSLSYRQTENGLYSGYGYPYGSGQLGGYPYFSDSGYAFPGRYDPNAAAEFEYRVARPGSPPSNQRPVYQNERTF